MTIPATDKDGKTRPSPPSIGAYEAAAMVAQSPVDLYSIYGGIYSLLTISTAEDNNAVSGGWNSVVAGHVYRNQTDAAGLVPLFRLYNPATGDHVYTASASERAAVLAGGAQDESITGYVFPASVAGSIALYRAYNMSTDQHLYTTNAGQYTALAGSWQKDGAIAYIMP